MVARALPGFASAEAENVRAGERLTGHCPGHRPPLKLNLDSPLSEPDRGEFVV